MGATFTAKSLNRTDIGSTLIHRVKPSDPKRRYRIESVVKMSSHVVLGLTSARGKLTLPLPNLTEIEVEP